jgi:predicted GH43/DUF377 family glycosyl hydrolase
LSEAAEGEGRFYEPGDILCVRSLHVAAKLGIGRDFLSRLRRIVGECFAIAHTGAAAERGTWVVFVFDPMERSGAMAMRTRKRLLLEPANIAPTCDSLKVVGVFNPGAADFDGRVVLLARIAQQASEKRPGWVGLPRWQASGETTIDWLRETEVEWLDARVVRIRSTGLVRLSFVSDLRLAWCTADLEIQRVDPTPFCATGPCEEYGVEDPRITLIDGRYYITYVAVSRHGAATALASTEDFSHFQRHGIIFPPENKDVVLFPQRIAGSYAAIHRPNGATPFTRPQMWTARSPDLIHWGGHRPLPVGTAGWNSGRVGAGTPPIRLLDGWLEIYHGNRQPTARGAVGDYVAAALVLDPDEPSTILRQGVEPLLAPTESFECEGFVDNVVFPTGVLERDDALLVVYGASDKYCAVAQLATRELEAHLEPNV